MTNKDKVRDAVCGKDWRDTWDKVSPIYYWWPVRMIRRAWKHIKSPAPKHCPTEMRCVRTINSVSGKNKRHVEHASGSIKLWKQYGKSIKAHTYWIKGKEKDSE